VAQAVHKLGTIAALSTGIDGACHETALAADRSTSYAQQISLYWRELSGSLNKSTTPTADPDHLF
jgi:hypothetical protein